MKSQDSAIDSPSIALDGLGLAFLGVLAFSFSFPGSVLALEGLDPYLVSVGRAAFATLMAAAALAAVRARLPRRDQWAGLVVIGLGVIVGFPVLSTLALDHGASSSHAAVVIGLLPAATAVCAVLRAGERPSRLFWASSAAGAACVSGFALARGAGRISPADLLLIGALLAGAVGYTEGGRMARDMAGWRVISWTLVLFAPVTVPVTAWLMATTAPHWTGRALTGFAYVSIFSMFLGFFAWYAGMARAGVARASQIQLTQPILTLAWAALFLGDHLDTATVLAAIGVMISVALTQRSRISLGVRLQSPAEQDGRRIAQTEGRVPQMAGQIPGRVGLVPGTVGQTPATGGGGSRRRGR